MVRLFRAKPGSSSGRILVVSTTGLGDTLWGTPAVRALGKVSLLTSPVGAEVFKGSPYLEHLFVLKGNSFFACFALYRHLKRLRFETIYVFHASQRPVFPLCALLGARELVGSAGINKGLDGLFTRLLEEREEHAILRRLRLIGKEGASTAMEVFTALEKQTNVVGLHPGAKDGYKMWPKEFFIELGNLLQCPIVVSGTEGERLLVEEVARGIPGATVAILPFSAFATKLTTYSAFITNDTGPMHLAFALQVPTIALFGPTDPRLCGPLHVSNAHVLHAKPTCQPCLKRKCRSPFCLRQISPKQVATLFFSINQEKIVPKVDKMV